MREDVSVVKNHLSPAVVVVVVVVVVVLSVVLNGRIGSETLFVPIAVGVIWVDAAAAFSGAEVVTPPAAAVASVSAVPAISAAGAVEELSCVARMLNLSSTASMIESKSSLVTPALSSDLILLLSGS